jgi:hypothetical protein
VKPATHFEIRNVHGEVVCGRSTEAECRRLLAKYVTKPVTYPGWSAGPYSVVKITWEHRFEYRPKAAQSEGKAEP